MYIFIYLNINNGTEGCSFSDYCNNQITIVFILPTFLQKGGEDMIRSYKIRLLPNQEQEQLLWKHINTSRFVWNFGLSHQEELYKNNLLNIYPEEFVNSINIYQRGIVPTFSSITLCNSIYLKKREM